jgi:PGF-pre-PGF domain-containing protein
LSWSSWDWEDFDATAPYSIFFYPDNEGFYEFYSRAWDDLGNYEEAPAEADARCGYDGTPPDIPVLISPENGSTLQFKTPTFVWTAVSDLSGVTYELVIDNEPSFTLPYIYYKVEIPDNEHTIENALGAGVYYWRVRAKNGAGLTGGWSDNYKLTIEWVWHAVETWSGTVEAPVRWYVLETWSAEIEAPARWYTVETWIAEIEALAQWYAVEIWMGRVESVAPTWYVVGTWNGNVKALVEWYAIETWTGMIEALTRWYATESWIGTIKAPTVWYAVEGWSGLFLALAQWHITETWTGKIEHRAWAMFETWGGVIWAPSEWTFVEAWTGSLRAPSFTIAVSPTSDEVEQGESISATVTLTPIAGYNYEVSLSASGQPGGVSIGFSPSSGTPPFSSTMTISVGTAVPAGTYTITITGTGEDGTVRSTTYSLTIIEVVVPPLPPPPPPVPPTSHVEPIEPYWQASVPFEITAWARDNDGVVVRVELWYRYSIDNENWGDWKLFGTDENAADNWSWSFTAPEGDGYYEFYSLATDDENNTETPPTLADARCGVDTTVPAMPALLFPPEGYLTTDATPTFDWTDVSDLSGVTYELVIDNDASLASPVLRKKGLENSSYSLLAEESLEEDVYFWRVRATDGAGNLGEWSEAWWFVFRVEIPTIAIGPAFAGETIVADFSAYRIFIVEVSITLARDMVAGEAQALQLLIEEFAGSPEHTTLPSGVLYKYFGIVGTTDAILTAEDIDSARIVFRISMDWMKEENVGVRTIQLLRWTGSEWENLETRYLRADGEFMYFESSTEELGLFVAVGQRVVVPPPPPPPIPIIWPPLVVYALLAMLAVIGGGFGYFVYIRRFRPIAPKVPLKRVVRPAVPIPKVIPKVPPPVVTVTELKPAPITRVPVPPKVPVRPVPVVAPPAMPVPAPPAEILEALRRAARPLVIPRVPPKIPEFRPPEVLLTQLIKVAKPVEVAVPLKKLVEEIKLAPAIPVEELEKVARPLEPAVMLEKLKEVTRETETKKQAISVAELEKVAKKPEPTVGSQKLKKKQRI